MKVRHFVEPGAKRYFAYGHSYISRVGQESPGFLQPQLDDSLGQACSGILQEVLYVAR